MIINTEPIWKAYVKDGPLAGLLVAWWIYSTTGGRAGWGIDFEAWWKFNWPFLAGILN